MHTLSRHSIHRALETQTGKKKVSSNDLHCLCNYVVPIPPGLWAENSRKWNLRPCLETSGQVSDLFSKCPSKLVTELWNLATSIWGTGAGKELHSQRRERASARGGSRALQAEGHRRIKQRTGMRLPGECHQPPVISQESLQETITE